VAAVCAWVQAAASNANPRQAYAAAIRRIIVVRPSFRRPRNPVRFAQMRVR
jgi:hypothetical protein